MRRVALHRGMRGDYRAVMTTIPRRIFALSALLALGACRSTSSGPPGAVPPDGSTHAPAQVFFDNVARLCGRAFAGRIVADTPSPSGADPFAGKPLVMHVRECDANRIRIPFFVGDDRSRTWVLTRTGTGLRLKHDHRHPDGSEDAVTMYGGDSSGDGSAVRQTFPVDAESRAMFDREGRSVSNTNVWAMEIEPGRVFVYELSRPQRLFRVEFDLTRPVPAPPAPWGAD